MTLEEAIKHCEEKSRGTSTCNLEHQQLAEWLEELKEYRKNARKDGKSEALKDFPRWKKANVKERFKERMIVLTGDNDLLCTNYAEVGEYYIPFSDLEKLPKEDEK